MYDPQKVHYIAVTGIVVKDGKFLITKRAASEKAFPNRWTVPGGKLEVDNYAKREKDTPDSWSNIFEDLLKREIEEEVGLKVKNIRYLTSLTYMRPDGIPTLVVSFFADHAEGEVKLCSALTEYAWVTSQEARKYDLIGSIQEELDKIDKILSKTKT